MGKRTETFKPSPEKMDARLRFFLLFGFVVIFFSISSCSSNAPEDKNLSKETSEGIDVNSVKIRGESIHIGESANTVYDRIGTGSLTTATNDPAQANSILKLHTYASEGKIYRISICRTKEMPSDHVCRISILKLPQGTDPKARSGPERGPDTKGIDSGKNAPKVFSDKDLQKYGQKDEVPASAVKSPR
jgi:hypothetical protein